MIVALLFALQGAPAAAPPPPPLPPQDWSALRTLPLLGDPSDDGNVSGFVRSEVLAGHCGAAMQSGGSWTLRVDVAVLIGPAGQPRRIVPRAIQCPSVEQYAAGLVSSMARANRTAGALQTEGWYKTSLTFAWTQ
ncbi:hypothetical protein D9601_03230 [Sphingomonas sp. MA1305]|uniref:hypothetical protein n=1 Tax=unclassified Sphingomonas TaxID=196159 RepID=UPI0018E058B6|nr:hypothetical protein [Sphingomonas sp. MA1305]MBI0474377.1 hypothetical protein [Sphingomonas sp. MA1305]